MDGLGSDALQLAQGPFDRLRIHLLQKIEAEPSIFLFEPPQDLPDPFRLLPGQSPRLNGLDHRLQVRRQDILPVREPCLQLLKSKIAVPVIGVLRKNGPDQHIQEIIPSSLSGDPEMPLQETGNPDKLPLEDV